MSFTLGESSDHRTISLRQRTRSSDGYSRLSTDDEDEELPTLSAYRNRKRIPKKNSNGCASFCCVFSLFGIVFLSIITQLLHHNSKYLKLTGESNNRKPELVNGVIGAIIMYVICLGVSIYFMLSSPQRVEEVHNPRLDD